MILNTQDFSFLVNLALNSKNVAGPLIDSFSFPFV